MNASVREHMKGAAGSPPAPIRRYLPHPFDLQPFGKQSAATLADHLDVYQSHVVETNAVLDAIAALDGAGRELPGDPVRPAESLARRLSFELSGLTLHELLFSQYVSSTAPATGSFELAACHNFGSVDHWKAGLRDLARARGIGWVVTLFDVQHEYLHNVWVDSHDLHMPAGLRPIFVLDLWEHAWLGDYGVKGRDDYVENALFAVSTTCLDARIDAAEHGR